MVEHIPSSMAAIFGLKMSVSPYISDSKILVIGPTQQRRPRRLFELTLPYTPISIIDLKTGLLRGQCQLDEAVELKMSQKNYDAFMASMEEVGYEPQH